MDIEQQYSVNHFLISALLTYVNSNLWNPGSCQAL